MRKSNFQTFLFVEKSSNFMRVFKRSLKALCFFRHYICGFWNEKQKRKLWTSFPSIGSWLVLSLACVEFNNFQNRISVNIKRRLHHHAKKLISFKRIPFISFSVRAALCLWNYWVSGKDSREVILAPCASVCVCVRASESWRDRKKEKHVERKCVIMKERLREKREGTRRKINLKGERKR